MDGTTPTCKHLMNSGRYGGFVDPASVAALDAASLRAESDPEAAIAALPWLTASLAADAGLFALWGRSTVIDENVGMPVLPRGLFDALHALAGLPSAWPVGNAGLLHVYGYLLSTTPTPYGLKRQRWLDGALALACGLDADAFLPWKPGPSLLARATDAATRLLAAHTVHRESVDGVPTAVALSTPAASSVSALAYAVDGLIVTMFPVSDTTALLAGLGAPRLRWNAAIAEHGPASFRRS